MPTGPNAVDRRDSAADTAPLEGSIAAVDTHTGLFPSPASANFGVPAKFASTVPGWFRPYDAIVLTRIIQKPTLPFQSSDARQLRGTSYDLLISVAGGASSARAPLPSVHCVGSEPGSLRKRDQSGVGTAVPTQESDCVLPASPVRDRASARMSGFSKSRNSPMPPLITPEVLR